MEEIAEEVVMPRTKQSTTLAFDGYEPTGAMNRRFEVNDAGLTHI
jgi:hypothetical protein